MPCAHNRRLLERCRCLAPTPTLLTSVSVSLEDTSRHFRSYVRTKANSLARMPGQFTGTRVGDTITGGRQCDRATARGRCFFNVLPAWPAVSSYVYTSSWKRVVVTSVAEPRGPLATGFSEGLG